MEEFVNITPIPPPENYDFLAQIRHNMECIFAPAYKDYLSTRNKTIVIADEDTSKLLKLLYTRTDNEFIEKCVVISEEAHEASKEFQRLLIFVRPTTFDTLEKFLKNHQKLESAKKITINITQNIDEDAWNKLLNIDIRHIYEENIQYYVDFTMVSNFLAVGFIPETYEKYGKVTKKAEARILNCLNAITWITKKKPVQILYNKNYPVCEELANKLYIAENDCKHFYNGYCTIIITDRRQDLTGPTKTKKIFIDLQNEMEEINSSCGTIVTPSGDTLTIIYNESKIFQKIRYNDFAEAAENVQSILKSIEEKKNKTDADLQTGEYGNIFKTVEDMRNTKADALNNYCMLQNIFNEENSKHHHIFFAIEAKILDGTKFEQVWADIKEMMKDQKLDVCDLYRFSIFLASVYTKKTELPAELAELLKVRGIEEYLSVIQKVQEIAKENSGRKPKYFFQCKGFVK
uniref:Uncharacterized protein n=1 Tax=Panagrolaimus sp. JU765 TaxID=591449 RepID=A0AC34RGN1_9BILA